MKTLRSRIDEAIEVATYSEFSCCDGCSRTTLDAMVNAAVTEVVEWLRDPDMLTEIADAYLGATREGTFERGEQVSPFAKIQHHLATHALTVSPDA